MLTYLHVWVCALQELLNSLEVALNIQIEVMRRTSLEQLVHGLHTNRDKAVSGIVPVEISVDPRGEILSNPVPLLRAGGRVVDQFLHVGRVQTVLLVGGVDVVHQPLVPRPQGRATATRHSGCQERILICL